MLDAIRCVPLCMLEAVAGKLCLLEALKVEVPEVMRRVLLCLLEMLKVLEVPKVMLRMLEVCWRLRRVGSVAGGAGGDVRCATLLAGGIGGAGSAGGVGVDVLYDTLYAGAERDELCATLYAGCSVRHQGPSDVLNASGIIPLSEFSTSRPEISHNL